MYYFIWSNVAVFWGAIIFLFELPVVERKHDSSYLCTEGNPGSATWDSIGQCEIIILFNSSQRQEEFEKDMKTESI